MLRKKRNKKRNKETKLSIVSYELTDDAIENEYTKNIPKNIKKQMIDLHGLLLSDPGKAINKILKLLDKHPNIPTLRNNLASAYGMIGQTDKAYEIARQNYEKFPKYIFALTSYAQICMDQGKFALIPKLFNFKYDLNALYPKRKRFHFTEFIAFAGVMSRYFYETGEEETAKMYFKIMKQVDKRHPMTMQVKRMLYPPLLYRIARKILGPLDKENN